MPKVVPDRVVFDAVLQALTEFGYAGATTRHIAELADVNEATLFRKFGTKEELITKSILGLIEQDDFESMILYTGDIRTDLKRVLDRFFANNKTTGQILLFLMSEINRFPELQKALDHQNRLLGRLGMMIARYQAEGVLRPEHPFHTVAGLLGPIALIQRVQDFSAHVIPTPDIDAYLEVFLIGRELNS